MDDWSVTTPRGLTDTVHDAILELLMNRGLEPARPCARQTLADRLGVSATPVREALARLEGSGLVVRSARRGYRAAPLLSSEELGQLVDVRLWSNPATPSGPAPGPTTPSWPGCGRRSRSSAWPPRSRVAASSTTWRPTGPSTSCWPRGRPTPSSCGPWTPSAASCSACTRTRTGQRRPRERGEHEAIVRAFERRDPAAAAAAMRVHLERVLERAVG